MRSSNPLWLTLALVALMPSAAAADGQRAAMLSWARLAGAEACVDAVELAQAVEQRLGGRVFHAPDEATLLVEGHARKTRTGFAAHLRLVDLDGQSLGERELETTGPTCDELSQTLALVLGVIIDPDGKIREAATAPPPAPPEPRPEVTCPEPVVCPAPPEPEPPAPAQHAPRTRGSFGLLARFTLAQLPDATFNYGAFGRVRLPRWGAVKVHAAMSRGIDREPLTLAGTEDVRATFDIVYGGLEYCPLNWQRGRSELLLCAGAQAGQLRVNVRGTNDPGVQRHPWATAVGGVHAEFRLLGPLRLALGVSGAALLTQNTFRIGTGPDGSMKTDLYPQERLMLMADLALVASFPN